MDFQKMGLGEQLCKALEKEGITRPMPVQAETFAPVMDGKNICVQSETGSGKTLAYLLPVMEKLLPQKSGNKVLILVPTHELAIQVTSQVRSLNKYLETDIVAAPVVGNVNIKRQMESLKDKPQIIVGTTGRILELIQKKKIAAHLIWTVIIDEADKMLEKQQVDETKAVLKKCMRDVQKLWFSASMPEEVIEQIKQLSTQLEVIRTKEQMTIPESIHHLYVVCEHRDKLKVLRSIIAATNPKKAMVFINRAYDIEEATDKLQHHNYQAACIHGSERKEERKRVVEMFRNGKLRILVGTDMAARGLHFDNVDEVIHYSIPENTKDYLHRAGRTGRSGSDGMSISIVTKKELPLLKACRKEYGIQLQECVLNRGMLVPVQQQQKEKDKKRDGTKKQVKNHVSKTTKKDNIKNNRTSIQKNVVKNNKKANKTKISKKSTKKG